MEPQRVESAHQEQETAKAGSFAEMEDFLPNLSYRFLQCNIKDGLTSYLGRANPFAHPFNPKTDALWLFDNTAHRRADAPHFWQAEFVAAYFLKESGKDLEDAVAKVAEKLGIAKGDEAEETIRNRIRPFVDSILPARIVHVTVDIPDGHEVKLGSSDSSGISTNVIRIPGWEHRKDGECIRTVASTGAESPEMSMTTIHAEPEGWGIISDIDDTIKTTLTPSPIGILKTTFATPVAHPIDGMPDFYKHINGKLNPTWFYLSASPYNLYPFLRDFRSQHYPQGTIMLRNASWMTLSGLLSSLTQGTQEYKTSQMDKIHGFLPKRKWICVGDSTQTDPESYGEIYRKYPNWVHKIFIRKVTDVAEMNETDKNEDSRFTKAFEGVPNDIWQTFDQPEELYAAVDALTK
ncbi:MAG: hypothetical protein M4579_007102 [Chaenotheca gracillima]|nr:MAG: hypothetical protein M4579_007102 [Chaenotheca gracillima]